MTGALARGARPAAVAAATALAAAIALAGACGKKAPLRLPDQRPAERADTPRATVREGTLTLEFRVPSHRVFPEREEPWVLARVLRRDPPAKDFTEVGAILESGGFAFDAPLSWTEEAREDGSSAYQVEFRDGERRRRALSLPVEIAWQASPPAPTGLAAAGDDRAILLTWDAAPDSQGTTRYRVYRRESPGDAVELMTGEPVAEPRHADARVRATHEYCYRVRSVRGTHPLEIESAPSPEVCARAEDATPPPPPAAVRVTATPGGFQLTWDEVTAADLFGYRVYRAIDDGPLELLTPAPMRGNAFREDAPGAPAGARYRYLVTAVDESSRRNESPFSPAAEALAIRPASHP